MRASQILYRVGRAVLRGVEGVDLAGTARPGNRVLVVRSTTIGDFSVFLPFLASVVREYGRENVDLLILSRVGSVAERFLPDWGEQIFTLDMSDTRSILTGMRRLRVGLRSRGYGKILFAGQNSEQVAARFKKLFLLRSIFGWRIRIAGVAMVPRVESRSRLERSPDEITLSQAMAPFASLGRPVDVSRDEVMAMLNFKAPEREKVDSLLRRVGTRDGIRRVGVYVSSTLVRKRWSSDNYEAVCRHILRRPDTVLCLVGGTEDRTDALAFAGRLRSDRVHVLAGETSIRESILLLSGLDLLVGNDGSPMHLAALSGTPVLSIFCNWEVPGLWEPIVSRRSRSIRPSWKHRWPDEDYGIGSIPPEAVIALVDELLDGESSRLPAHAIVTVQDASATEVRGVAPFPFRPAPDDSPPGARSAVPRVDASQRASTGLRASAISMN